MVDGHRNTRRMHFVRQERRARPDRPPAPARLCARARHGARASAARAHCPPVRVRAPASARRCARPSAHSRASSRHRMRFSCTTAQRKQVINDGLHPPTEISNQNCQHWSPVTHAHTHAPDGVFVDRRESIRSAIMNHSAAAKGAAGTGRANPRPTRQRLDTPPLAERTARKGPNPTNGGCCGTADAGRRPHSTSSGLRRGTT